MTKAREQGSEEVGATAGAWREVCQPRLSRQGRLPQILHLGNIANNGYNNVKFLRRLGVEAHALNADYPYIMGQPEWEDADFNAAVSDYDPQWGTVELNGFCRPAWYRQVDLWPAGVAVRPRGVKRALSVAGRLRFVPQRWRHLLRLAADYQERVGRGLPGVVFADILRYLRPAAQLTSALAGHDLIQAYGIDPIYAMLFAPQTPFVAFEHGTMRDLPFESSPTGRLLALAYQRADHVIITNPDVLSSAHNLGLTRISFVPHPIDEEKLQPGGSPLAAELRREHEAELILFAPSRHNWAIKGNEMILEAVARFRRECKPRLLLVLCDWGQEMARSRQLIGELGLAQQVKWIAPQPKMRMVEWYNAADLVLDQFKIGTFGTVTPEAMACGKPVILHFDEAMHRWCYSEMPPVATAHDAEAIAARLAQLQDPNTRHEMGARSRDWVCRHHGWRLVAERQLAIYDEVWARRERAARLRC